MPLSAIPLVQRMLAADESAPDDVPVPMRLGAPLFR
jgi:hypothetical protein